LGGQQQYPQQQQQQQQQQLYPGGPVLTEALSEKAQAAKDTATKATNAIRNIYSAITEFGKGSGYVEIPESPSEKFAQDSGIPSELSDLAFWVAIMLHVYGGRERYSGLYTSGATESSFTPVVLADQIKTLSDMLAYMRREKNIDFRKVNEQGNGIRSGTIRLPIRDDLVRVKAEFDEIWGNLLETIRLADKAWGEFVDICGLGKQYKW
jgi:hypothetical protein